MANGQRGPPVKVILRVESPPPSPLAITNTAIICHVRVAKYSPETTAACFLLALACFSASVVVKFNTNAAFLETCDVNFSPLVRLVEFDGLCRKRRRHVRRSQAGTDGHRVFPVARVRIGAVIEARPGGLNNAWRCGT